MSGSGEDFTPRPYQVDLYERAIKENTIIYLPTGSGKTFIAVLLVKKYSNQVQLPYNEGGKRIIFVVNTVPLVTQQRDYIARHTGLKCSGYSGDMAVDFWSKDDWLKEIQEAQVMVMVAEIFNNVLNHGHMPLSKTCLIIFDECHKAVGHHPMRNIMKSFERYKKEEHPRVLGLTATLLNANTKVDKVRSAIRELEITFHARIATVDSALSVKDYGNLQETFTYFDPPVKYGIEEKLMELCDHMCDILAAVDLKGSFDTDKSSKEFRAESKNAKLKSIVEDTREHVQKTGLYGGSKAVLMHMIQLECIKKFTDDAQTITVIEFLVTQMTKMRKLMEDRMDGVSELEQMHKFSADQVLKTFSLLLHFNENKTTDQQFCCIIFVRRRSTAQILYHILQNLRKWDKRFDFLHPEFMVGYSNNPYKNPREGLCLSKWNKEALLRFRSGRSNCIVATDVVDEGVDVPSCTLIVRYDLPADYRGYMQSKGRARHKAGVYAMLISRLDSTFRGNHANYKLTDTFLRQELVGHSDERDEVSAEEIDENLYKTEISPYTVTSVDGTESAVTGLSAIALINRYCVNLVKSKFVNLTPTWILHKVPNGLDPVRYKVALTLPSISPLKETVEGDEMDSISLAKRSAALKACIRLHQIRELSDRLIPLDSNAILGTTDHLFPHWETENKAEARITGTPAQKRHHETTHPESLYAAFPREGNILYLHIIEAKPTYPKPFDNRTMAFYDMLNNDKGFGILSTKPMAAIPCFPIFMNVGDLNVNVRVNNSKFTLSSIEIRDLRIFHWIIFHDVLNVIKSFMAFDLANQSNSFMVVPTDAKGGINWEVVNRYKTVEVESFDSSATHDFDFALVRPNYRASPSVYVVTQICEDIMAESCFPTDDFYSYVHYYKERHGLIIREPKQPMLEVKAISKKINCIRPRGLKAGLSKRKRADLLEDFQEHFVGELCSRIVFPALYWLKATYLPSVLHRISQLLVASDLRVQIAEEARLGVLNLQPGRTWPPIIIKQTDEEESSEALLETSGWTGDDSTLTADLTTDIPGPEIDSLGLDSKLYPWTKDQEPTNLFKDVEHIRLIDIEYYHQFMSTPMATSDDILKKRGKAREYGTRATVNTPPLRILSKADPDGPSPGDMMQALTSKLAHDVFDLERLETLGDSLLKFAVSAFLFEAYPKCNEGQLTVIKGKLIGNRYLFYCGKNKKIPGRLKVDDFVPLSNFIAPSFCALRPIQELLITAEISPNVLYELNIPPTEQVTGVPSDYTVSVMQERVLSWNDANTQTDMQHFLELQVVPDKSVADCVEALIGVYLSTMGLEGAFKILIWFGILPPNLRIKEILHETPPSPVIGVHDHTMIDRHLPLANTLEQRIGYKFKNRAFLLQALTHPSYTPNTITPAYERLEFLGDAILDFLITVYIYESCDFLSPGALTDLRSALVNNITFACLAVKYGLHVALMSFAPLLQEIVERFAKFQQDRDYAVDDELLWILLEEEECNMAEFVDVPKVLGDIFESMIGAIYLDTGKNLQKVWEVVYGLMHKEIAAFSKNVPKQPVRVIHETAGANARFSKGSTVEGSGKTMITLEVTVAGKPKLFHGFGANKRQAKCAAAKQALKCIRSNV